MLATCNNNYYTCNTALVPRALHYSASLLACCSCIIIVSQHMENSPVSEDKQVASFCLTIPGKVLHISTLLAKKFFRNRGNKDGAVRAIKILEKGGLGTVYEDKPVSGTTVVNIKCMDQMHAVQMLYGTIIKVISQGVLFESRSKGLVLCIHIERDRTK